MSFSVFVADGVADVEYAEVTKVNRMDTRVLKRSCRIMTGNWMTEIDVYNIIAASVACKSVLARTKRI